MSETIQNFNTERDELESFKLNSQRLGSKVLTNANFEQRHKKIVDSSFNKALANGEKLYGGNSERRNYSYLSRINNLVERYGNRAEKKIWNNASRKLIIDGDNIPDSYWKTQEQILRDNGQGRELDDYEKELLTNNIKETQEESLKSWSNYLGSEESPYPMWFKIYAWDGMSKMGVFDKSKKRFAKRDRTTVAPYPKMNPAVLAKTYSAIVDFYGGQDDSDNIDDEINLQLKDLIKTGNFNAIYSKILLGEKTILKTPERTEDVHGKWIEYLPGEEDKLASAAEGTPWCVAEPNIGHRYLKYGDYNGPDEEWRNENDQNNKAKFILFHLEDQETGLLSESACASIRLNTKGYVAEISGLNDGQALEDSLVPIVEEKVKSLPGGENFLQAFRDKNMLMMLDNKMKNGEDLTKDELDFIYEIERPIAVLDTYNKKDPRVNELRNKYDVGYALDAGVDAIKIVEQLEPKMAARYLDSIISRGISFDANALVEKLWPQDVATNIDILARNGADINGLIDRMGPSYAIEYAEIIKNYGVDIDTKEQFDKMGSFDVEKHFHKLVENGITINDITQKMGSSGVARYFYDLVEHGVDVNILTTVMANGNKEAISYYLNDLIKYGANINDLIPRMRIIDIYKNMDDLLGREGIDIEKVVDTVRSPDLPETCRQLLEHGANVDRIIEKMKPVDVALKLDILTQYHARIDVNELVSRLNPPAIAKHLDTLMRRGADINVNELVEKLPPFFIRQNADVLRLYGADVKL